MHTELLPPLKLVFSATETAVKPHSALVRLPVALPLHLGEGEGSGNEASVSMRCEGAVSSTHSRPLSPVATSRRLRRRARSQAWRPVAGPWLHL